MKLKHLWLLSSLLALAACKNDPKNSSESGGPNSSMINNPVTANLPTDTTQLARIRFSEMEYDFGEVKEGDAVVHRFQFSNTGQVPLTILKAYAGCGCTVPEWPQDPIPPGGNGEIMVKFKSEGKKDGQNKAVKVVANTYPNETTLRIKAFVKAE